MSPINVRKLLECVFDATAIESYWYESSLLVGGVSEECGVSFEDDPFGVEGGLAHDQDQRPRAFQPLFDGQRDRITGLDHPLIKPHPQPIPVSRSANSRTAGLSALAWLRKTSYSNSLMIN